VLKVPRRETGMTPYEIMLSETQERMLVIVKKEYQDEVANLFRRWGLRCDVIGRVTGDGLARIKEGEVVVAEAPVKVLTDPPMYSYPVRKPAWLRRLQSLDLGNIPDLTPETAQSAFLKLLASPNICSRGWVFRHSDPANQAGVVLPPGGDGGMLSVPDSNKGLSFTVDGNGRYCYLDPYTGGIIAVAEAGRNLVCTGTKPLAVTDCLNLGKPENKDVYYQLKESIRGIGRACRKLNIQVISGNVSLYNEGREGAIYPTPICGMMGLIENIDQRCDMGFVNEGERVFLLGSGFDNEGLGGSEYLELIHGLVKGRPYIDLDLEKRVQSCCLKLIKQGVISSAHDCADGGLAITLAECCLGGKLGFKGEKWQFGRRVDAALFGEVQSRIIVSVSPEKVKQLETMASANRVPVTRLGAVGGKRFTIADYIDLPLEQIEPVWRDSLEKILG